MSKTKVTTVSTKGQVILPKEIRDGRRWSAGTRLVVENVSDGVLLREAPAFAPVAPDRVFGMLPRPASSRSIEEMRASVTAEARRRHARD